MRLDRRIVDMALLMVRELFVLAVVALRIELSVTALSGPSGQPVLDYRISRAPRSRTEPLLLPKQACSHLHLRPICQSERSESNRRSVAAATATPGFATFCLLVTRVGVEPNLIGLKDR